MPTWIDYLPPGLRALMTGSVPPITPTFPGETPMPPPPVAPIGQVLPRPGLGAQQPVPPDPTAATSWLPVPAARPRLPLPGAGPTLEPTVPPMPPPTPDPTGSGSALFTMQTQPLPAPPQLPMPPARGVGAPMNFAEVNKWLEQMAPTPSGHTASVLGGFASGAERAGKAPTFAQALAAIGAGGTQGFQTSSRERAQYAGTRAGAALEQVKAKHEHERESARIAGDNAQRVYDTIIKNQMMVYEHQLKQHGLDAPEAKMTANGILLTQTDPKTRQQSVTFVPTRDQMQTLEKTADMLKVMGADNPMAQGLQVEMVSRMYQDRPHLARPIMQQLAVQQVVSRGAGEQVFGPEYKKVVEAARRQLVIENPTLAQRPAELQTILNTRISSMLMNQPWINNLQWLPRASGISIAAQVLQSGEAPRMARQPPRTTPLQRPGGATPAAPAATRPILPPSGEE